MTHQVVEYQAAGMDGVVPKPVDMGALFQMMEEALACVADDTAAGDQRNIAS